MGVNHRLVRALDSAAVARDVHKKYLVDNTVVLIPYVTARIAI